MSDYDNSRYQLALVLSTLEAMGIPIDIESVGMLNLRKCKQDPGSCSFRFSVDLPSTDDEGETADVDDPQLRAKLYKAVWVLSQVVSSSDLVISPELLATKGLTFPLSTVRTVTDFAELSRNTRRALTSVVPVGVDYDIIGHVRLPGAGGNEGYVQNHTLIRVGGEDDSSFLSALSEMFLSVCVSDDPDAAIASVLNVEEHKTTTKGLLPYIEVAYDSIYLRELVDLENTHDQPHKIHDSQ